MNTEENRGEVVKMVKSCLVLNKGGLSMRDLNKVYRDLVGNNVPYRSLGYSTLEDFLQSVPEIYSCGQNAGGDLLLNVQDDNLKHIQDLVSHQKSKRKPVKKHGSYARYSGSYGGAYRNSYSNYRPQPSYKNYTNNHQNQIPPRFLANSNTPRKSFAQNNNYDPSNCYPSEKVVQNTKKAEFPLKYDKPSNFPPNEKMENENSDTSNEIKEKTVGAKENLPSSNTQYEVRSSKFASHSAIEEEILSRSRMLYTNSNTQLLEKETSTSKNKIIPKEVTVGQKDCNETNDLKIRSTVKQADAQEDRCAGIALQEKPLTSTYRVKPETCYKSRETSSVTLRLPSLNIIRKEEYIKNLEFNMSNLFAPSSAMSQRPACVSAAKTEPNNPLCVSKSVPPGFSLQTSAPGIKTESQCSNKISNITSNMLLPVAPCIQSVHQLKNINPPPGLFSQFEAPKLPNEPQWFRKISCPPGFSMPVQVSSHFHSSIEEIKCSGNNASPLDSVTTTLATTVKRDLSEEMDNYPYFGSQNSNNGCYQGGDALGMENLSTKFSSARTSDEPVPINVDKKKLKEEMIQENKQGFHILFNHQLIGDDFMRQVCTDSTNGDNEYELCLPGFSIGDCLKKIKEVPLHTHVIVLVGNIDILQDLPMATMKLMMTLLIKELISRVQRVVFLTLPPLMLKFRKRQKIILQKQKEFNDWLYQQRDEMNIIVGDLHSVFIYSNLGAIGRFYNLSNYYSAPGVDESFALWSNSGLHSFVDYMAECCPVHV